MNSLVNMISETLEPMAENVPRTSSQFSNNDRINDRINLSETEKRIFSEIESFCKNRRACFF